MRIFQILFVYADANKFIESLPAKSNVVERESATFTVQVKDPDAPVDFFIAGKKVTGSDDRVEVKKLENGKHQLIVHKIKMSDDGSIEARTPSNFGDQVLTSSCTFNVAKGEGAPTIGKVPPVTGIAKQGCNWNVPYEVRDFGGRLRNYRTPSMAFYCRSRE